MEMRGRWELERDVGDAGRPDQAAILAGRREVNRGRASNEGASRGVAGERLGGADGGVAEVPCSRLAVKDRRIGDGQADASAQEEGEDEGGEPAGEARAMHRAGS